MSTSVCPLSILIVVSICGAIQTRQGSVLPAEVSLKPYEGAQDAGKYRELLTAKIHDHWPVPWSSRGQCGGVPANWLPGPLSVVEQTSQLGTREWPEALKAGSPSAQAARTSLQPRSMVMSAGCRKAKLFKVPFENVGPELAVRKSVKPSERPLVECIQDARKCSRQSQAAALRLPGIKFLLSLQGRLKVRGLPETLGSCALVGNAGHLSKHHYGPYIDSHDTVIRFNVQKTAEFSEHVGNKTFLRVANHRRSLAMCCRGNWPEARQGVNSSGIMVRARALLQLPTSHTNARLPIPHPCSSFLQRLAALILQAIQKSRSRCRANS